jgi:hypothetical protein
VDLPLPKWTPDVYQICNQLNVTFGLESEFRVTLPPGGLVTFNISLDPRVQGFHPIPSSTASSVEAESQTRGQCHKTLRP